MYMYQIRNCINLPAIIQMPLIRSSIKRAEVLIEKWIGHGVFWQLPEIIQLNSGKILKTKTQKIVLSYASLTLFQYNGNCCLPKR